MPSGRDNAAAPDPLPLAALKPGDYPIGAAALALASRMHPDSPPGSVIADLRAGVPIPLVAERRGLPLSLVEGVRGFYDLIEPGVRVCEGTACRFGGGPELRRQILERRPGDAEPGMVRCLGHCHGAPAFQDGDAVFARPGEMSFEAWSATWAGQRAPAIQAHPIPRRSLAPTPVVLRHLLTASGAPTSPRGLDRSEYELPDGETILRALEVSHLRGRGGALYPTAAKWRAARDTPAAERFVVANGDEGDPGSYVDRLLLEQDPHAVIAGMLACARAIGARHGILYIRAEYPHAQAVMREAVAAARAAGLLEPAFDLRVVSGAGSYVCGEETALLRSIEGRRGEPAPKPPYPAERGLYGKPTVVQNVETLALVPWVVRERRSTGTKALSLSGAIMNPGVVEIPLGMPLRRVLEEGGGGPPEGRVWHMALIGGPMGRVLPAHRFDTPLSYEALPGLGHGGIVVLDERVSPRALAEHLFEFARGESCGNCTPCRAGSARLHAAATRGALERLLDTMEMGSLCGFGQGAPRPIRDLLEHFGEQVLR